MRKYILLLLCLCSTLFTIYGRTSPQDSCQKKIIFVGGNNPPYEFIDNKGNITGFHVELVRELMNRLSFEYEIKLMPWDKARNAITNNEAHVLMGIIHSEERAKEYCFGLPHSYIYMSIVSRNSINPPSVLKDLENKTVLVPTKGKAEELLSNIGFNINLIPISNIEEGCVMLEQKVGDAMLCNNIIARYIIDKKDLGLKVRELKEYAPQKYCMATSYANESLILELNNGLQQLKSEGVYQKLYDKWFFVYQRATIPTWLNYVIIIFILLFAFVIVSYLILKKRVTIATKTIKDQNHHIQFMNDKLTQVNEELSIILNNTNSGYVYLSPDFDIRWENLSQCRTFNGTKMYSELGSKCYSHIPNKSLCESCPVRKSLKSGKEENSTSLSPLGRPIELTSIPIMKNGEVEGYILKIDDITQHQQMLDQLEEAKNKAEESDRLKSEFLANMSHEIRTPLNAVVGFSSLLVTEEDFNTRKEYQNIIETNTDTLLTLINDILDLSKIEVGNVTIINSDFDLNTLFMEVKATVQEKLAAIPNVKFETMFPYKSCIVHLDKNRIRQIIVNYVTNAIKYTEQGSITIGYFIDGKNLKIFVKDTGCGIPQDKLNVVFDRFSKLNTFKQGIGLGLPICKGIAKAYGGKVWVECKEIGQGCTFWAQIPCQNIQTPM